MDSTKHILQRLLDGQTHSGEELGSMLGISRAAVWKHIQKLIECGLEIKTIRGKGYQLPFQSELLAHQKIYNKLTPQVQSAMQSLQVFFEINSTNQYLLEQSLTSDIHGQVVLAEYQTAGKGRRGRQWLSPPASGVCLSIAWRYAETPELLHCLPLSMGLVVTEVLQHYQCSGLQMKWPNDIYSHHAKLAGMLLETRSENAGECTVVLGLGLNVHYSDWQRETIDQPVTALSEICQASIDRNQLAADLMNQIILLLQNFSTSSARNDVERWRSLDYLYGKQINVMSAGETYSGKACGINDNGLLQVLVDGQTRSLYSAEVSLKVSG